VATYTVTLTEPGTGCVVTGTLTMEKSTSASIQIPLGGLTQACAPQALDFINSSTNTSPNTVFQWNFGDGTGWITYDYTNLRAGAFAHLHAWYRGLRNPSATSSAKHL
jgi:hypothetical protein